MKYKFYILDVFSSTPFGGNQLAVLPDARGLSAQGMQKITREFNFAESTFVLPASDSSATARVRIFTPGAEVDFAGHPTVGTACALVYGGHVNSDDIVLEENIGPVSVKIDRQGEVLSGTLVNTVPVESPGDRPDLGMLAQMLCLSETDVVDSFFASVGLKFCFVQLASREAVDNASIDKTAWKNVLADAWSPHVFFFCGELVSGGELYARMSAPALGIEEDPATGSAAAALVGIAAKKSDVTEGEFNLSVLQGVAMDRRSEMDAVARLSGGEVVSVAVGGASAFTAEGEIEVSEEWLENQGT